MEALWLAIAVHPGKVGIIASPTYPLLEQSILHTWTKHVPQQLYQLNKHSNVITLRNGSVIYCRSSQNREGLQGINAAWFVFDEAASEPDKGVFDELVARLRDPAPGQQVQGILTGTPNGPSHWTAKVFGTGPGTPGFSGTEDYWFNDLYAVIRAATHDNPKYAKGSDYLSQLMNRADVTEDYISQYVEARFVSRTGLIFPQFKPELIVSNLPRFSRVYAGFDFGFASAGAIVLLGETADGKYYAFKEEYHKNLLCDESGWFLKVQQLHRNSPLEWIVCDSASPERIAALRTYLRHRPIVYESHKDTLGSIRRIQKLFNQKRLCIHTSCSNLTQELQNWSWKVHPLHGPLDTPQDGNDHAIDALRYIVSILDL